MPGITPADESANGAVHISLGRCPRLKCAGPLALTFTVIRCQDQMHRAAFRPPYRAEQIPFLGIRFFDGQSIPINLQRGGHARAMSRVKALLAQHRFQAVETIQHIALMASVAH